MFLPAAEPVPASKVEDITETGRLTSMSDATPLPIAPEASDVQTGPVQVVTPTPETPEPDEQPAPAAAAASSTTS